MSKMTKLATAASAAAIMVTVVGCGAANNNAGNNASGNTASSGGSQNVQLTETGSSLLYPLFQTQWISAYKSVDSSVSMQAASTGSGQGISDSVAGNVEIGASDAYLPQSMMQQNPGMLNIPLAISAQQIMYNLPGLSKQHLHLSAAVLAKIYEGKITSWNDPAIKALNPGVSLPNLGITPVVRSDGSGDTFLFTSFLSATDQTFTPNTTESWPNVQAEVSAKGNDGVVTTMANKKGTIGYVGISWLDKGTQKGLGFAALKNQAGNYVLPNSTDIKAAASNLPSNIPSDERVSLINMKGKDSYPIINFEYALVNSQKQPNAATAKALKKFLTWAINPNGGNQAKYLNPVHFQPLPAKLQSMSQAQINKIQG